MLMSLVPSACLPCLHAVPAVLQMYDYGDVCVTPSGLPHNCNMRCGGPRHVGRRHLNQPVRLDEPSMQHAAQYHQHNTCPGCTALCRMYHALEPPSYDLAAIDTPLAIFHGGQDRLAAPADVQTLLDALSAASVVYTQVSGRCGVRLVVTGGAGCGIGGRRALSPDPGEPAPCSCYPATA